jgi:2-octaprenyl-6-methoxyphenol hydroxylase
MVQQPGQHEGISASSSLMESHLADFEVVVAGGGPSGLAAACLLAQEGIRACLIAPEAPVELRTVALMQPALKLLSYIGVWPGRLQDVSAPLRQLHIVDDTGHYVSAPRLEFRAEETGHDAFGWNIPVNVLVETLQQRLVELGVMWIKDRVAASRQEPKNITVITSDGNSCAAKVAFAADGRNSLLRHQAGISMAQHDWKQKALVLSFAHSQPHDDISTEYHRPNGLMTTVPLPGLHSSLVWMDLPDEIDRKSNLPTDQLCAEIQIACHGNLGRVSNPGPKQAFNMLSSRAERFASNRTFLIGESAHAMPPIGAQGLNLSLRDVGHACDSVINSKDPGDAASCDAYHHLRHADINSRATVVGLMNQSLLAGDALSAGVRSAGLSLVNSVPPLRQRVLEQGLAPAGNLPFAMRG